MATVGQVHDLAGAVPERFRTLILLGAFTSLRWGELVDLQRSNIGTAAGLVEVTYTLSERDDGSIDSAGSPNRTQAAVPSPFRR